MRFTSRRGRSTKESPVLGIAERGGDVRLRVMQRVTPKTLNKAITENVGAKARLTTDESKLYDAVGKGFEGGHETVGRSAGQYQGEETDSRSHSTERVFSLLKRGVTGVYHSFSK